MRTHSLLAFLLLGLAACGDTDVAPSIGPERGDAGLSDSGSDITDVGTSSDVSTPDSADSGGLEDTPSSDLGTADTPVADVDAAPDVDPMPDVGPTPDADEDTVTPGGTWLSGDPSAAGPYAVSEQTERVNFGPREMEVLFFSPSDTSDAPFPVVVFNHGFQMAGSAYAGYGRRVASHGFVVLVPTVGDSLMDSASHRALAELQVAVNDWIEGATDAPGSPIFGLADVTRLGVGGHSRGGKQSIHAATLDSRIAATFNVDPVDSAPPFGGDPADFPSVTPELMGGLAIPSGYVGAGRGAESTMGPSCAPAEDNYHAYFEASGSPSFEWVLAGAGHNDFVETCDFLCEFACPVGDDREAAQSFAQTAMVAFYKVFLAEDESYRPWVDGDEVRGAALTVR